MKILNITLTVIFILFALVQYNDPDPYIWAPIYLFCAWVTGSAAMGKYNTNLILIGSLPIIAYTLDYIPDFIDWIKMGMPSIVETMKANKPYVELTREFGGLVICVAALAFEYMQGKKAVQQLSGSTN
jgi:hypothetical protein